MRKPSLGRILHIFCPDRFGTNQPRAAIVTGCVDGTDGTTLVSATAFSDIARDAGSHGQGFAALPVFEPQTNEQREQLAFTFHAWAEWPAFEPAGQREVPAPTPVPPPADPANPT